MYYPCVLLGLTEKRFLMRGRIPRENTYKKSYVSSGFLISAIEIIKEFYRISENKKDVQ